MTSPLVNFCHRLNSPATAVDFFLGFVLLAFLLSLEVAVIGLNLNPGLSGLASYQSAESLR